MGHYVDRYCRYVKLGEAVVKSEIITIEAVVVQWYKRVCDLMRRLCVRLLLGRMNYYLLIFTFLRSGNKVKTRC